LAGVCCIWDISCPAIPESDIDILPESAADDAKEAVSLAELSAFEQATAVMSASAENVARGARAWIIMKILSG